jgi:hypothetical protein
MESDVFYLVQKIPQQLLVAWSNEDGWDKWGMTWM